MRRTIEALRTGILGQLKLDTDVPEQEWARHPRINESADDPRQDGKTWESWLYNQDDILIVLSFNVRNLNADFNLQPITLHGHSFRTVRVFIYDMNKRPDVVGITPQQLVDALIKKLPIQKDSIYSIERTAGDSFSPVQLGHVLDLYIRNTGETWDIGPNLTEEKFQAASARITARIAAALNDLLPVAKYYAENRDNILAGRVRP